MRFGEKGEQLIPFKVDDKGLVWGAPSYSSEVSDYERRLEARFKLSPSDDEEVTKQISRAYRESLISGLGYLAVGLALFAAFVWTTGWIVRGFLGIPRGQDHRPEQPEVATRWRLTRGSSGPLANTAGEFPRHFAPRRPLNCNVRHVDQKGTTMEGAPASGRRRTGWIWVISIFYTLSVGWTLLSFYLILSGSIPIPAAQQAYFEALSSADIILTILIGLANFSGAIALFLLRRVAFHLFVAAFATTILLSLWHAATKGWVQALSGAGLVGVIIGYGISAVVCVYSWKLMKKGTLV
jgi:hypothetical protein